MLKHLPPPNPGPRPGRAVRPQQPLNVSALSAGSVVGSTPTSQQPLPLPLPLPPMNHLKTPLANGGPRLSSSMLNTPLTSVSSSTNLLEKPEKKVTGAKEALTSLGLLCLGELLLVLSLRNVLTRSLTLFPCSLVVISALVVDIPPENISGRAGTAPGTHTRRRLHAGLRCDPRPVRLVPVPELVLPASLRHPVSLRSEISEGGHGGRQG